MQNTTEECHRNEFNQFNKLLSTSVSSDLSRNNSDATSITSSFQTRKQITNPCISQRLKYVAEAEQQSNITATKNKNVKNLDEYEVFQNLID